MIIIVFHSPIEILFLFVIFFQCISNIVYHFSEMVEPLKANLLLIFRGV